MFIMSCVLRLAESHLHLMARCICAHIDFMFAASMVGLAHGILLVIVQWRVLAVLPLVLDKLLFTRVEDLSACQR